MAVENGVENMDKDVVDNMFDRFYRADRARASDGGGHGIGPVSYTHLNSAEAKWRFRQS